MQIKGVARAIIISVVCGGVCLSAGQHHVVSAHTVLVDCIADPATGACSPGADEPIVPLVCGVNLDCSDVDRQRAAQVKPAKKSGNSRTVRTSHSSNGASSTSVTTKTPAGSSTVTKSRTAKGVTTTSRSTTVSH